MILASFGFLVVSARPPRTKNWVLVICMLLMLIGWMLRCCFVVVVLVFVVGVVVVGCGGCCCVGVCGGDICGGGVGVLWLTQC